jgi:hypothetical protein
MAATRGKRKAQEEQKKMKKKPTITQEKEPTSPQLNNKEEQKEEEKQDADSNTTAATGTVTRATNAEYSNSSKEKGSLIKYKGIAKYWYYLAHTLKSAVWHKSTDRGKFAH